MLCYDIRMRSVVHVRHTVLTNVSRTDTQGSPMSSSKNWVGQLGSGDVSTLDGPWKAGVGGGSLASDVMPFEPYHWACFACPSRPSFQTS